MYCGQLGFLVSNDCLYGCWGRMPLTALRSSKLKVSRVAMSKNSATYALLHSVSQRDKGKRLALLIKDI